MEADPASYESSKAIADFLLKETSHRPSLAIICGSGLSGLADMLTSPEVFKYESIPGFPLSTVQGHSGELVFGNLGTVSTICMKGRFHSYEGYPMWKIVLPVRVMSIIGVTTLIVTNAAGGLNDKFNVGDLMIINDHLNFPGLAGNHPLVGVNDQRFGTRFPAMSNAYDRKLGALFKEVASNKGLGGIVREGSYMMVSGPSFETPIECKLLRMIGGDAVGMSTVPEVTTAVHCGITVLGISLITNKVVFTTDGSVPPPNHKEVLETGKRRANDLQEIVAEVVKMMARKADE